MIRSAFLVLLMCISLVVTATGLGIARGTVMQDGQIVLCTGEGVITVTRSQIPGHNPSLHLCPDMALSLMAAVGTPPVVVPQRAAEHGIKPRRPVHVLSQARQVAVWPRGPPAAGMDSRYLPIPI